jgi:DNA-binding SARP family transcriptional activator
MEQFHFLGPPRFARDAQPVDLPPAKAVALLAYLAVTRMAQTREALMALLWPESSDEAARKNLRNTLWAIRKGLGDAALHSEDDRLSLPADAWVDVWVVEGHASGGHPAPRDAQAAMVPLQAAITA